MGIGGAVDGDTYIPMPTGDGAVWADNSYGTPVWADRGYNVVGNGDDRAVRGTSGADIDVQRYRDMATAASGRAAPTMNYGQANGYLASGQRDMNGAMSNRAQASQAREEQMAAIAAQRQAAMGGAPSQAQLLGRSLIDQSLQAQMAGASGARGGPMAQAAAMRSAALGAGATQAQGAQGLAAMRAGEMAQARGAWLDGTTGMRGQDYAGAQQATQMAAQRTQMAQQAAQMEQVRASMEMQQRGLNQSGEQFNESKAFDVRQAQLQAKLGGAASSQQDEQFRQQIAQQRQQADQQQMAALISAGAGMGAAGIMKRAKGGPVQPGQPTLVGEEGPEVIIPNGKGTVLPAHHPASMTMAQVAKLRAQADAMEAGMQRSLAHGPAVGSRQMTASPQVIDDAPEAPREELWGGREDPYTADPNYMPPTWGVGRYTLPVREDPYTMAGAAGYR